MLILNDSFIKFKNDKTQERKLRMEIVRHEMIPDFFEEKRKEAQEF